MKFRFLKIVFRIFFIVICCCGQSFSSVQGVKVQEIVEIVDVLKRSIQPTRPTPKPVASQTTSIAQQLKIENALDIIDAIKLAQLAKKRHEKTEEKKKELQDLQVTFREFIKFEEDENLREILEQQKLLKIPQVNKNDICPICLEEAGTFTPDQIEITKCCKKFICKVDADALKTRAQRLFNIWYMPDRIVASGLMNNEFPELYMSWLSSDPTQINKSNQPTCPMCRKLMETEKAPVKK